MNSENETGFPKYLMENRSMNIRKRGGRRFSTLPSNSVQDKDEENVRRFSMPPSGFKESDEEKVESKSNKVRKYDKISQPGKISPLVKIAEIQNAIKNLMHQLSNEGIQQQQQSDLVQQKKYKPTKLQEPQKELEKQTRIAKQYRVDNVRLKKNVEKQDRNLQELQEELEKQTPIAKQYRVNNVRLKKNVESRTETFKSYKRS